MEDVRIERLARLLVEYSLGIKGGDQVLLRATTLAQPLIRTCYLEVLKRGAHPLVRLSFEGQNYLFYRYAREEQLSFVSEIDRGTARTVNGLIAILSEPNTKELTNVDPSKVAIARAAQREIRDTLDERELKGEFAWVLAPYPTQAFAQDAEMSLLEYEEFLFAACGVDQEDPVAYWKEVSTRQEWVRERLHGVRELRYMGPDTDLTLSVEGRKWINCDGKRNMPDGEVFTSPVGASVEGFIYFDYPACYSGVEVQGVRLTFREGRIVEARADKGEDFLNKLLDTDEGARYLGEVAFGLNHNIKRFTKNILFDEKIGGTIHMAAGAAYPETGGTNRSGLHWDFIKGMDLGEVYADGELIYKGGRFLEERR